MGYLLTQASSWTTWKGKKMQRKAILEEFSGLEGCINAIVFSEVLFVYIKAVTGRKSDELKKEPELVKSVELLHIKELLGR